MFNSPEVSLRDLLGSDYINHVIEARETLVPGTREESVRLADEKVSVFPEEDQVRADELLSLVGTKACADFSNDNDGAATEAYTKAMHKNSAPVGGFGSIRVGEDGKFYLIGKSEHYHASLGHHFAGYRLIENAHRLGIPNATHNNTRGYITRLLERELVRAANGDVDDSELNRILTSREPKVLNRVINLETGSVAAEAAVKSMLARFYRLDSSFSAPKYSGKTPVFLVMGDTHGATEANYHGTTVTTQLMRGLWGEIYDKVEAAGIFKVVPVEINNIDAFEENIKKYNSGNYKTAGFLHEIILMNYGAVRQTPEFMQKAYRLCEETDTPTMVDEIQTGMWYPGMFLFRIWGIKPDFVIVGKGFPGGEYPASKIITTFEMDNLNQFGALVTNGQEELASLSYIITMLFCRANAEMIEKNGKLFENSVRKAAEKYPELVTKVEGEGMLLSLHFKSVEVAAAFASKVSEHSVDTSAQLYKPHCPPAVLFKPPVISSEKTLMFICDTISDTLENM